MSATQQPTTLVAMDADETAIAWKEHITTPNRKLIQQNAATLATLPNTVAAVVTTRGLKMSQEIADLADYYKQNLVAWITNTGQQIFVKPANVDFSPWFRQLTPEQSDKSWEAYIHAKTGWRQPSVSQIIRQAIIGAGFTKVPNPSAYKPQSQYADVYIKPISANNTLVLEMRPDETAFIMKETHQQALANDTTLKTAGQQIHLAVASQLHQQNIAFDELYHGDHGLYVYTPKGIQKGMAVTWLAATMPLLQGVKTVVTAGDGRNDGELLARQTIDTRLVGQGQRQIPTYPIVSGQENGMLYTVVHKANPGVVATGAKGDLASSLALQHQRAQQAQQSVSH